MSDHYTPSLDEIRRHWGLAVDVHRRPERLAEFDRAIERMKAAVWDEALAEVSRQFSEAYHADIFPEPDFAQINRDAGPNSTARVAAAFARHWANALPSTSNPYREDTA